MDSVRTVSFAGSAAALEFNSARTAHIVDFLFSAIPTEEYIPPRISYKLTVDYSGKLIVHRGEELFYKGDDDGELAEFLLGDVCTQLVVECRGGMMFHAAALSWRDHGLLLPGGIGAGKSTLAAWLVGHGFNYLSDELVYVPLESNLLSAFPRPLHLKRPSRKTLANLLDLDSSLSDILSSVNSDLVPATLFKTDNAFSHPALSLILFPQYDPHREFSWSPVSPAQAGLKLLECLVNARNLPEKGFAEAARLARLAPAYQAVYNHFGQIEEYIISALTHSALN